MPAGDRNLGANAKVLVGLGTADPTFDIAGSGLGVANYQRANPYRTRQVPGGGKFIGTQRLDIRDGSWTWTMDDTDEAAEVFWFKSQRRFTIWDHPDGDATGEKVFKAQCIATVGWTAPTGGTCQVAISLAADGEITEELLTALPPEGEDTDDDTAESEVVAS